MLLTSPRVQAFPYLLHKGPVHSTGGHANGTMICGVISEQQGWQDIHIKPGPDGRHVAMNHILQRPLEVLHHGTFDVIILAGEEVCVFGQSLEGRCTHFGALVTLHSQWWSILHVVQDGLHGARHFSAALAGQRLCPGILGKHVYAAEEIPGAAIGLSVLAAVHQVAL